MKLAINGRYRVRNDQYRQIRAEVTTVINRRGANAGVDREIAGGNGEEGSDALWWEKFQSKQELQERM